MGSFAYVMNESFSLQVPIKTPLKKQPSKMPNLPLKPGYIANSSSMELKSKFAKFGFVHLFLGIFLYIESFTDSIRFHFFFSFLFLLSGL